MNDNLEIGQYGEAHFCSKHTRIHAFGWIRELEPKVLLFADNGLRILEVALVEC